jgi:hypothetical protein
VLVVLRIYCAGALLQRALHATALQLSNLFTRSDE